MWGGQAPAGSEKVDVRSMAPGGPRVTESQWECILILRRFEIPHLPPILSPPARTPPSPLYLHSQLLSIIPLLLSHFHSHTHRPPHCLPSLFPLKLFLSQTLMCFERARRRKKNLSLTLLTLAGGRAQQTYRLIFNLGCRVGNGAGGKGSRRRQERVVCRAWGVEGGGPQNSPARVALH